MKWLRDVSVQLESLSTICSTMMDKCQHKRIQQVRESDSYSAFDLIDEFTSRPVAHKLLLPLKRFRGVTLWREACMLVVHSISVNSITKHCSHSHLITSS